MSKVRVVAVLMGMLLATPTLSQTQGQRTSGGGGSGFRGGIVGLVTMDTVQKEVQITDAQKAELAKISEAPRGSGGGFNREKFEKLSEEELAKRFAEMHKQRAERAQQAEEKIKMLLQPEQWARLSELRIQQEGLRAVGREDVQKQLGLNEEQIGKIKTLTDGQRRQGFDGGGNPQNRSEEEIRKAREERETRTKKYEDDIAAVLTSDQKTAFEKLKGAKFEFPLRRTEGAGGGRRRPE